MVVSARAARQIERESGRLGVSDPVREPVPAASRRRAGGWWLPASVLLHGGLLAGVLLLSARAVLPPELEPAIPLVFESG